MFDIYCIEKVYPNMFWYISYTIGISQYFRRKTKPKADVENQPLI